MNRGASMGGWWRSRVGRALRRRCGWSTCCRAEGVTLPDKGDVSDLKQALGKGTLRVLEQLQARAPVLSRRVSDADYEEFFDGIKGCKVQNGCICTFASGDWVPISNFVALPIEEALLDDGNGDAAYRVKVVGWSSLGHAAAALDDEHGRIWTHGLAAGGMGAFGEYFGGAGREGEASADHSGSGSCGRRYTERYTAIRDGGRWTEGCASCTVTGAIGAEDVDVIAGLQLRPVQH